MAVINSRDLDARMGQNVNPNSVPRFDGTGQGAMQAHIMAGSEQHHQGRQIAREGAMVYDASDLPGNDQYGTTVISVNDAPPLLDQHDPVAIAAAAQARARAVPVQVLPKVVPKPLAQVPAPPPAPAPPPVPTPGVRVAFPALAKAPAATKPAPAVVIDPNGATAKLMASLGLVKPKK